MKNLLLGSLFILSSISGASASGDQKNKIMVVEKYRITKEVALHPSERPYLNPNRTPYLKTVSVKKYIRAFSMSGDDMYGKTSCNIMMQKLEHDPARGFLLADASVRFDLYRDRWNGKINVESEHNFGDSFIMSSRESSSPSKALSFFSKLDYVAFGAKKSIGPMVIGGLPEVGTPYSELGSKISIFHKDSNSKYTSLADGEVLNVDELVIEGDLFDSYSEVSSNSNSNIVFELNCD